MKELSTDSPFIREKGGQLFTTSIDVAEKFGKQHKNVLQSVHRIMADCQQPDGLKSKPVGHHENDNGNFGILNFRESSYLDDKGERRPMFEMTKSGFSILAMGFTGKKALQWKIKYDQAFSAMEQALANQKNLSWKENRAQGKIARKEITETIKAFVAYAQSQGSQNAPRYYPTITNAVYKCLFVIEDRYGKSFRDLLSSMQLQFLGTAEYVAANAIEDGMSQRLQYREIYQLAKSRVEAFASTLPRKTKVITRQQPLAVGQLRLSSW